MHPRAWLHARARRGLGARFLRGEGIEIGALHRPFPVPPGVRVRYVDRCTTAQLAEDYPELAGELVSVDAVDDAHTLATVPDRSQDFVIASHLLELLEDPIAALRAQLRVLRPGGVLLLVVGDRRRGLDARRPGTALEHVLADHAEGPARSRTRHYREWAELVDVPLGFAEPGDIAAHAERLERGGHPIHFHCWTPDELLAQLPGFGLAAEVAEARRGPEELLVVLRPR